MARTSASWRTLTAWRQWLRKRETHGVICHTIKGLGYGKLENSPDSHGAILPHPDTSLPMQKLGFPTRA